MTNVFLTGATGTMGWAGLHEILKNPNLSLTILARKSKKNIAKLQPLQDKIKIVWGDLTCYDDVLKGVSGSDIVLHVGGMVSPQADYKPKTTRKINIGAAQNITKAVLAQPAEKQPKVVYIGSVAQTSDRNEPIHWGRTGDPISISVYDHYAITKTIAERIIVDSGIKKWVCLRQSGILYPAILKNFDPIMFHVPIRGVLEWATVEDSGRILANICDPNLPDDFWNRFYNIGSGAQYRLSNYEFEQKILKAIGCPPAEKIFDTRWFVLRNFHGQWYLDSEVLENYLHFRANIPVDDYFAGMSKHLPWYFKLTPLAPAWLIKPILRKLAFSKNTGTQDWIKTRNRQRIAAFYGTYEAWQRIPDWEYFDTSRPMDNPQKAIVLDHGYDETKPLSELDIEDMKKAAEFRGGKCISDSMVKGDMATPLEWECQFGHRFKASPALVLLGGHWCPECLPAPWNYDEIAKNNKFFAQVWTPLHHDEHNYYDEHIFDGWE